jgi:hypothetical protein
LQYFWLPHGRQFASENIKQAGHHMGKILRLDREKEAIEKALDALYALPVEQIVVAARFADRSEEVFFYGNPKEIIQLLALAQFQIGFRYPLGVWDKEKDNGQE